MWGAPKRNGKCPRCRSRGQCSCQRRINEEVKRNPTAAPRKCARVCRPGKGACGHEVRGGKCPCGWC